MRNRISRPFSHRLVLLVLLAAAWLFGAGSYAQAASFDCKKARTPTEHAICFDETTSKLDEQMASSYFDLLRTAPNSEALRQSQRDWTRLIRNGCGNIECLQQAYTQRISDLRSGHGAELRLSGAFDALYAELDNLPPGISYGRVPPGLEQAVNWLQKSATMESVQGAAALTGLPDTLRYTVRKCGSPNALFLGSRAALVLCYELLQAEWGQHTSRTSPGDPNSGLQEARRLKYGLRFALLHELGHAAFKSRESTGLFGREESAADSFAFYLLLKDAPESESVDSLWGVYSLFQTLGLSQTHYADEHEMPMQRLASFSCMLAARNPQLTRELVNANFLTKDRSARCPREWAAAQRAIVNLRQ